jgi:peptidoglycan-associated lipoprotein
MQTKTIQLLFATVLFGGVLLLGGCGKKTVTAQAPQTPPPPQKPTATISLSRPDIPKGDSTVLTWSTANADTATISGLGTVPASGSRTLTPADSTTYSLMAKGPGGEAEATARVTVTTPPPVAKTVTPTLQQMFAQQVKDVFFDYDKYGLRDSDRSNAETAAAFLKAHPQAKLLIEGHCDERGSEDYNMALGDNRANSTREYLVSQGIGQERIRTISYGKEKPFCEGDTEQCWQQNRRAHFALEGNSMAEGGN